ncbi:MAG: prolipoprotein diacylglyceryl transferase [Oscillospiraceae bacterium]|nr:prolipoprotein diacylglyceryl transferase [Oscillospiraceae bacterium]
MLDNVHIRWYGVIIAVGMLLALAYAYFSAERFNVNRNKLIDCVLVGIVTGIIGARLYYVLFELDRYIKDPVSIFMINEGGLAIYGGIIGGLLGGCITAKILKQKIMPILDVAVLGFLIGQGIGRWGNFMNQEAYGAPTDLPWGMVSENTHMQAVHPCFLYESLWCLLGFVLIHFLSKKFQKYSGQVFYFYLVWYGFERMIVEGLRTDSLYLPFEVFGMPIRVSQVLSALILIFGIVMLIINRKKEDKFYDNYRRKKGVRRSKRASG